VLYGVAAAALASAQTPAAPAPPAARPAQTAPAAQAPPAARPAQTPAATAAVPTRIAVINLSEALGRTREGQKAGADMNNKIAPRKVEFDKRQAEISTLTEQLNKGRATMSDDAQKKLAADIQAKTTAAKRYGEDAQAEMENDEAKITQELQTKMQPILTNYAIQNNFAVVLDIGSQQSPVLWFASATDITAVIVALYDQAHPVKDEPVAAPKTTPPAPPAKKQ
jgi:outer membrane protein